MFSFYRVAEYIDIYPFMDKEDRKDSTMSSSPGLTIDKAAFLLLRVKRVFRKKKQQRKEKR